MAQKAKYLWYIEETKKHHPKIVNAVKSSVRKARTKTLNRNISITYLHGSKIVVEYSNGEIQELENLHIQPRKVKVGDIATI